MSDPLPADEQLVNSAKAGNTDAASELFERHWDTVWRTAYAVVGSKAQADEVAQDAFVAAMSALDRFEGRSSFRTWVTRIAINKALSTGRQEWRLTPLWDEHESPESDRSSAELLNALASLTIERRTVIVLRHWLGCSVGEISELLEVPVGTVNSRLARGLRELRALLEVNCIG
jgi:RNA polymerase sigma-70 factor (ECF subfamily)